ncbi:VOC family protein [Nocardioides mangrovicus]|uniref:VOC family protein n=1 Tax=Nocardioides mangrovicus TaxID=2478913 RepID=A0A3L8P8D6_9ACTN|nr:VOC family protein [Nocardioides mangrovicus]RLV51133.1 VOC family protein [Nocardioides mangrovicus]
MALHPEKSWFGVVLECADASELAHFYRRLLGWELFADAPDWATVAPSATGGLNLAFNGDPGYARPVWPRVDGEQQMQLHLDFQVEDLDEAVDHALACGATLASFQPQDDVRVLLDPAGHPFCVYLDSED